MAEERDGPVAEDRALVFISYSRADQEVAGLLNASLVATGRVSTFLDTKDIQIGDSIPSRIYSGIEQASHILYLISSASINSAWAAEELSAAKVRQLQGGGCTVLPVLIEDVEVPTGLQHIAYGDLRDWRSADSYRTTFLGILRALGISPRLAGSAEVAWYAVHLGSFRTIEAALRLLFGQIRGGLYANISATPSKPQSHYLPTKWAVYDDGMGGRLQELVEILEHPAAYGSARLEALRGATVEAQDFLQRMRSNLFKDARSVEAFKFKLETVVAMLNEVRAEVEVAVFSSVAPSAANPAKEKEGP